MTTLSKARQALSTGWHGYPLSVGEFVSTAAVILAFVVWAVQS